MPELNLENLKKYKDEILKAEIGALLFNLGKTHIGFNFWRNYFQHESSNFKWSSYKDYVSNGHFNDEIKRVSPELKKFFYEITIDIDNVIKELKINEIMLGGESNNNFVKKIFFRGCENINSGIDKGNPVERLKPPLWLSNAFGSFKHKIEEKDFDEARICFYNKFHRFLSCNNYYEKPNWQEIRKFIFAEIENWYSRLLSDSRFPINDITLWDQAYMTASMFKAVLSNLVLDNSKLQNFQDNPSSIKWRILGIQYDKLGLAEKGFKPAHIDWYRSISEEIDDEIKKLLELKYPIGNEVYRDETGIYFIVGEDLGKDLGDDKSNLAILKDDLKKIKEEILQIFKEKSLDEFYPAIFLTKASRGLMNLTFLIEKAKENFLKADWSKKETDICLEKSESGKAKGTCQVCGQRLVFERDKSDEDKNICDICLKEKTQGRIERWFKNRDKETIWIDELKDKNDRVALVTMKFELYDWLNGNMLNSTLVREEGFNEYKETVSKIIKEFKKLKNLSDLKGFSGELLSCFDSFLDLFDYNGIKRPYENIMNAKNDKIIKKILTQSEGNLKDYEKSSKTLFFRSIEIVLTLFSLKLDDWEKFIDNEFSVKFNSKEKKFIQQNALDNNADILDFVKFSFSYGYIIMQIFNILLERSIGDRWEEFIYKKLDDWDSDQNKPKKNKMDFENRKIDWQNLTNDDIEFLSILILQFLLRKNPSPAKLRRIWESTQEFFEDIKANTCAYAGIPQNRRVRYYWENVKNKINNKDEYIPDGEYHDGEAVFWADAEKEKVYSISYIKNLTINMEFKLKKYKDKKDDKKDIGITLDLSEAKKESYQPYISIIDPTPISWQFIIPAEYVPNLIDNVIKKYNENFKFVYGKLPLHIGVVIQNYKKPLYVGVKALRKIRRDIQDTGKLEINVVSSKIKRKLKCQKIEESLNDTQSYYSLYKGKDNEGYEFYMKPNDNGKHWIANINKFSDDEKVTIIPNTFDFEFLDTNTRRNDIYYDGDKMYKRKIVLKSGRPYDLEVWEKFKKFKELFSKDNISGSIRSTKLQNLISVIYDKREDLVSGNNQIKNDTEGIKAFLASSFVNILKLNSDENLAVGIRDLFDIEKTEKDKGIYAVLKEKMTTENLQLFLDMFDFWHKTLKEV